MRMTKIKLMQRLRSQAGESITEVLVAVLIAALSLTMLALMISSTVSMVNTGKTKMNEYYTGSEVLEIQPAAGSSVTVTIKSPDDADSKVTETVSDVKLYENDVLSNTVYAYGKAKS